MLVDGFWKVDWLKVVGCMDAQDGGGRLYGYQAGASPANTKNGESCSGDPCGCLGKNKT